MSCRLNRNLAWAMVALWLSGCGGIPIRSGDTVHYLIIGVGVVSVPDQPDRANVQVTRMHALGLSLADQPGLKLGLGYASGTVVAVPADVQDVRIEVSQRPFGPLHVRTNEDTSGSDEVKQPPDQERGISE